MAGRDLISKCWATLAYGAWVATALRSETRKVGALHMKGLFLPFIVGLGVGVLYGLLRFEAGSFRFRVLT